MNLLADYFPKEIIQKKEVDICQTDLELKPLLSYSYSLIRNNTKDLRKEFLWQPFDCVSLVYYYNVKTIGEAKVIIRNFILNEVRKSLNEKNEVDRFNLGFLQKEKYCSNCKQLLPIDEFYLNVDYKNGMQYHKSICKKCTAITKKEQRKKYRATPEAKAKAKARYERWKLKNKKS